MNEQSTRVTGLSSLWERLRNRKVVQWTLVYVAIAWGLLQCLGFVADAFGWPPASKQVATLALAVGLFLVLVLAWFHGDRGQQRVTPLEMAIVAMLLAGGGALTWYVVRSDHRSTPTTAVVAEPAVSAHPAIAVLAFDNRSPSPEDAYFVEGVHDDILAQLSKIGSMTVIARTSVEAFRGKQLPVAVIARQLGATSVLEGGVQRAGDRVRVQVRLVDARHGTQVWAESYDRELTAAHLFAIQSEVATSIAETLAAKLTPAERARVNAAPTSNLEAWQAYQIGQQRVAMRTSAALDEATTFFQRAIDLDPNFALAYAGLADAIWLSADYGGRAFAPARLHASALVKRALALDPELPEALVTKAKFLQLDKSFAESERLYRQALALKPSYAIAYLWYAQLLNLQNRSADALRSLKRAVELDPMSTLLQTTYGDGLAASGRFDEARRRYERAREIDPRSPLPVGSLGQMEMYSFGRYDLAVPLLVRSVALGGPPADLAEAWLGLGDFEAAEAVLRNHMQSVVSMTIDSYVQLARGNRGKAIERASAAMAIDPGGNFMALSLLRSFDLRGGKAELARSRYARAFPELVEGDSPRVDAGNYPAAIDLALVLKLLGSPKSAEMLLKGAEAAVAQNQRLGSLPWGFELCDVAIQAVRGQRQAALETLERAIREGWRGPEWQYYRDIDPNFAAIRADPRFKAAFAVVARDVAQQRGRIQTRDAKAQR
jgi:serine/threonine-protein kinase